MAERISEMRLLLKTNLEKMGSEKEWSHITTQIGMFSYTGLNQDQTRKLIEKVYILNQLI
jgi:aspartate aminotransferase